MLKLRTEADKQYSTSIKNGNKPSCSVPAHYVNERYAAYVSKCEKQGLPTLVNATATLVNVNVNLCKLRNNININNIAVPFYIIHMRENNRDSKRVSERSSGYFRQPGSSIFLKNRTPLLLQKAESGSEQKAPGRSRC